jgi:hypothetical protein
VNNFYIRAFSSNLFNIVSAAIAGESTLSQWSISFFSCDYRAPANENESIPNALKKITINCRCCRKFLCSFFFFINFWIILIVCAVMGVRWCLRRSFQGRGLIPCSRGHRGSEQERNTSTKGGGTKWPPRSIAGMRAPRGRRK